MDKGRKYIKVFEEFKKNLYNNVEFTLFTLKEETETEIHNIEGIWTDRDTVVEEAQSHDTFFPDSTSEISMGIYDFKIPFDDMVDIIEFEIDDYDNYTPNEKKTEMVDIFVEYYDIFDYDQYYKTEVEPVKDIGRVNDSTNDMIDEVIGKLNKHFGVDLNNGFYKYTRLYIDHDGNLTFDTDNGLEPDDEKFEDYEIVNIRIGNHTHNPRNGKNDLNVIIAEEDKTSNRFLGAKTQLVYGLDDNVEDIVHDIINFWK